MSAGPVADSEVMGGGSRKPRAHRRVVRRGTERFEGDGLDDNRLDGREPEAPGSKQADDDRRILGELPPHWGMFPAERGWTQA
ncbi:hypothetical protein BACT_0195 [Bifidobacterium actinocoloniiforme DSM 22766]|uniref:Uncharacterized protein n=1 Tax=Bifidobacterium actinocoloniiforme DSM 22766 TaxID=1437605 RepID=A0A086YYL3_9BIFI|nr:hypothetical protein [Bifidobacterium actinocoloniiforme]AKV55889.1 hypothetical protein AB656_06795 [Bifidobacterium actinocoloniiforme DSM 22766]KFI39363.1 hypothetical protein BACT_0195 [Bifidobacterium actinocoloniiforme DSM 22766]